MMKNDNIQTNGRRGSSPAFQDPEQDFYNWLNSLKAIGQKDESTMMTTRRPETAKVSTIRTGWDFLTPRADDELRWQDDGGK